VKKNGDAFRRKPDEEDFGDEDDDFGGDPSLELDKKQFSVLTTV